MNLSYTKQNIKEFFKTLHRFKIFNLILNKLLFFNLRFSNYFLVKYEYAKKNEFIHSYPLNISLNTTNICNYRCVFCESIYFYNFAKEKAGKIFPNHINLDFIKKFERLFKRLIYIDFTSASGEPLLNPYFINICKFLKKKHINLIVTTNGSLLDKFIAANLVDMKFNHITISMHSGEEKNYHELMGGDFNKVLNNIEYLIKVKKKKGIDLPKISINCLISTLNQHTIKNLIKKVKALDVNLNLYNYYASRNKVNEDISFYSTPEAGSKFLEDIYQYAESLNFKLLSINSNFIENRENEDSCKNYICDHPWKSLEFRGSVEFENSHYIGVCGRIMLFRLNYKEFDGDFHKDIWNHEIIKYLRKCSLKNPICQFCQAPNRPKLRNLDNKQYQIKRDIAIRDFFANIYGTIKIEPKKGIYLLNKNPYEYTNYYEKFQN